MDKTEKLTIWKNLFADSQMGKLSLQKCQGLKENWLVSSEGTVYGMISVSQISIKDLQEVAWIKQKNS